MEETQLVERGGDNLSFASSPIRKSRNGNGGYLMDLVDKKKFPLKFGENKIGRDGNQCQVIVNDPGISRVHAIIDFDSDSGEATIHDVGSANKSWKNSRELKPEIRHALDGNEILTFANKKFIFKILDSKNNVSTSTPLSSNSTLNSSSILCSTGDTRRSRIRHQYPPPSTSSNLRKLTLMSESQIFKSNTQKIHESQSLSSSSLLLNVPTQKILNKSKNESTLDVETQDLSSLSSLNVNSDEKLVDQVFQNVDKSSSIDFESVSEPISTLNKNSLDQETQKIGDAGESNRLLDQETQKLNSDPSSSTRNIQILAKSSLLDQETEDITNKSNLDLVSQMMNHDKENFEVLPSSSPTSSESFIESTQKARASKSILKIDETDMESDSDDSFIAATQQDPPSLQIRKDPSTNPSNFNSDQQQQPFTSLPDLMTQDNDDALSNDGSENLLDGDRGSDDEFLAEEQIQLQEKLQIEIGKRENLNSPIFNNSNRSKYDEDDVLTDLESNHSDNIELPTQRIDDIEMNLKNVDDDDDVSADKRPISRASSMASSSAVSELEESPHFVLASTQSLLGISESNPLPPISPSDIGDDDEIPTFSNDMEESVERSGEMSKESTLESLRKNRKQKSNRTSEKHQEPDEKTLLKHSRALPHENKNKNDQIENSGTTSPTNLNHSIRKSKRFSLKKCADEEEQKVDQNSICENDKQKEMKRPQRKSRKKSTLNLKKEESNPSENAKTKETWQVKKSSEKNHELPQKEMTTNEVSKEEKANRSLQDNQSEVESNEAIEKEVAKITQSIKTIQTQSKKNEAPQQENGTKPPAKNENIMNIEFNKSIDKETTNASKTSRRSRIKKNELPQQEIHIQSSAQHETKISMEPNATIEKEITNKSKTSRCSKLKKNDAPQQENGTNKAPGRRSKNNENPQKDNVINLTALSGPEMNVDVINNEKQEIAKKTSRQVSKKKEVPENKNVENKPPQQEDEMYIKSNQSEVVNVRKTSRRVSKKKEVPQKENAKSIEQEDEKDVESNQEVETGRVGNIRKTSRRLSKKKQALQKEMETNENEIKIDNSEIKKHNETSKLSVSFEKSDEMNMKANEDNSKVNTKQRTVKTSRSRSTKESFEKPAKKSRKSNQPIDNLNIKKEENPDSIQNEMETSTSRKSSRTKIPSVRLMDLGSKLPLSNNVKKEREDDESNPPILLAIKRERSLSSNRSTLSFSSPAKMIKRESSSSSLYLNGQISRGRIKLKPKVMFSNFEENEVVNHENQVLDLGGTVVENIEESTVLVTQHLKRSAKLVCAIGRGIPIVGLEWLSQSKSLKYFLDPWKNIIHNSEFEKKYAFVLETTLRSGKQNPILGRLEIHVTKNVVPPPEQFKEIIECSGGKYLKSLRITAADAPAETNKIVISCAKDKTIYSKFIKAGFKVLDKEFLLTGIIKHELDFKTFVLKI